MKLCELCQREKKLTFHHLIPRKNHKIKYIKITPDENTPSGLAYGDSRKTGKGGEVTMNSITVLTNSYDVGGVSGETNDIIIFDSENSTSPYSTQQIYTVTPNILAACTNDLN